MDILLVLATGVFILCMVTIPAFLISKAKTDKQKEKKRDDWITFLIIAIGGAFLVLFLSLIILNLLLATVK